MGIEIGEAEFLAQHVVERPARAGGVAPDAGRGEARRGGEAAPQAPFALAGDDGVHGQRQRIELRRLTALDHVGVEPLVLVDIELEQLGAAGECGDFLDAKLGPCFRLDANIDLGITGHHRSIESFFHRERLRLDRELARVTDRSEHAKTKKQ